MNKAILGCYVMPQASWHHRLDGGLSTLKIYYYLFYNSAAIIVFRFLNNESIIVDITYMPNVFNNLIEKVYIYD